MLMREHQQGPAPERPSWVLLLHPGASAVGSFHHGPMGDPQWLDGEISWINPSQKKNGGLMMI